MAAAQFPIVSNIKLREIHEATRTTELAIHWCKEHGLLATQLMCPTCARPMRESKDAKRNDGFRWRYIHMLFFFLEGGGSKHKKVPGDMLQDESTFVRITISCP